MSKKAEELLQQQKSLAEQLRQSQLQQSQTQYNQGQRALRDQLRMQRMEMQKSRSGIEEQSASTQRNIQQGAAARGLGGSGLRDMSLVQSQLAQGRSLSDLEQSNMNVQRGAMDAKLRLSEQLTLGKTGAESQYMQNVIEADKYGVGLDQQKTDQLLQLYKMAIESGGTADIEGMASILGLNLDDLTPEQKDALLNAAPKPTPEDSTKYGGGFVNTVIGPKQGLSQAILDAEYAIWNGFNGEKREQNYQYDFGNGKESMSVAQATDKIRNMYAGKQYMDVIKVEPHSTFNYKIGFKYAGKWYKTYNQAVEAVKKDIK